jgi:hypothetical protein
LVESISRYAAEPAVEMRGALIRRRAVPEQVGQLTESGTDRISKVRSKVAQSAHRYS